MLGRAWCCLIFVTADDMTECVLLLQGAEAALRAMASCFGADLMQKLPRLWQHMSSGLAVSGDAQPAALSAPPLDEKVCSWVQQAWDDHISTGTINAHCEHHDR